MFRSTALVAALLVLASSARAEEGANGAPCPHCHPASATAADDRATRVELADATLLDQDGRSVRFAEEVGDGRVTVMTFVFTSCTTVCPVLSAIMRKVQDRLGDRAGKDVRLVSVSLDPVRDTPARMRAFAERHRAKPGWLWLTGEKDEVDRVLRGMGAYAANFADHSPIVLVGAGRSGAWTRFNGFPSEDEIVRRVDELLESKSAAAAPAASGSRYVHAAATAAEQGPAIVRAAMPGAPNGPVGQPTRDEKARTYFTNTELVDATGKQVRFYDDVLKDRLVLITFMFTRCNGACPLIAQKLIGVRRELGEPLASEVRFVSISVDPEHDTPEQMAAFARKQRADDPRWVFLTGSTANVRLILQRLGQQVSEPTDHSTGFIAANVKHGHWKRIRPDVAPAAVAAIVRDLAAAPAAPPAGPGREPPKDAGQPVTATATASR